MAMVVIEDDLPCSVNGGMKGRRGVYVHPVEVDAPLVGAVVASHHTVRVQQRDHLEYKQVTQPLCPRIPRHYEVKEAVEHKAGGRLAGVDPGRDEDHLFTRKAVWPQLAWNGKEAGQPVLSLIGSPTVRADSEEINPPAIQGVGKQFTVVIEAWGAGWEATVQPFQHCLHF